MIIPGATQQFTATPDEVMGEWQYRTPDYADFLAANVAEGFEHTTTDVALTERHVWEAERAEYGREAPGYQEQFRQGGFLRGMVQYGAGKTPEYIAKDDWNEEHPLFRKGIKWQEHMTPVRAQIYAEDYDKREFRQMLIEQGKNAYGFWGGSAPGFFAGMLGNLPDPINAIPFGRAVTAGKGVTAGIKTGMVEGALGSAAVDLFVLPDLARRGADVGIADFALDVAFGAFIGGGLGGLGGGLGAWHARRTARAAEVQRAWLAARDAEEAAQLREYHQTHGAFIEAGRDRFLDKAGEEGRAVFDTDPDSFLARNGLGDFTRRNLHGADRQTLLNAFEAAVDDFTAGRPVDVGPILRGSSLERHIEGRISSPDEIVAFFHDSVNNPNHQAPKVLPYHNVTLPTAMRVFNESGVDVSGYVHVLDESSARHINNNHFGAAEILPENVPITDTDLRLLSSVVEDFDRVSPQGKNRGNLLLRYEKKMADGTILFAEELRNPRTKHLVPITLMKVAPGFEHLDYSALARKAKDLRALDKKKKQQSSVSSLAAVGGDASAFAAPAHYVQKRATAYGENIGNPAREVNRFAVEASEDFISAPPVSKEVRSALDEMGVDPKTGMTTEEVRATEQIEQGRAPREEADAFMRTQDAETLREKMEEAGYAALDCILEVIE